MKHASCRELYRYWDRVRDGRPAPRRSAIEPRDISGILGDTFILAVGREETYPFRLAGTRLCAVFARELKGTDFLDLWGEGDRQHMRLILSDIAEEGHAAITGIRGSAQRNPDREVPLEVLLLPLIQDGPGYDRILGVVAPMELPFWLGVDPVVAQSIASVRVLWPDRPLEGLPRLARQNPERTVAELPRPRPRLTVVEGGKSVRAPPPG